MFSENLKYLRSKFNMDQIDLAEKLGRKSSSSISEWEKGKYTPKAKTLAEIASIFSVDLDDLMNVDLSTQVKPNNITVIYNKLDTPRQKKVYSFAEDQLEEQNKVVSIEETQTVYLNSKLSAGTGILDLDPTDTKEIEYNGYVPKHDLAFKVSGDSMYPTFEDGEIVFVEKTPDIYNGQFIAVQINEAAFLKKVYIEDDCLRLVSLNKEYDDIITNGNDDIRVIGRVIL